MYKLKDFKDKYIDEAVLLSLKEYSEEKEKVNELPENDYKDKIYKLLKNMPDNNLGAVLFQDNKIKGYIKSYGPIDNFFGNSNGAFVPLHGHGTVKENREYIYSLLYQYAAEKWYNKDLLSYAITLYAHNKPSINSFFQNGFGLRCVDAISNIDNPDLKYQKNKRYDFKELIYDDLNKIEPLKNKLIEHLGKSPTFLIYDKFNLKKLIEQSKKRNSRFFIVSNKKKVLGYLEIKDTGENFTTVDEKTVNICGAYLIPEYRGDNLFKNLISFMFKKLRKEGYIRCGVDFESFNPTAFRFWLKYFKPYTNTVTRRVDEKN